MTTVQYKGYQGSVSFDGSSLVIRILHIEDFVTSECDKASDAQSTFEELVDDYIQSCLEVGDEPCKPFKGSFNVRVNPALHRAAAMAAAQENESLNAWVAKAIETRLNGPKTSDRLILSSVVELLSRSNGDLYRVASTPLESSRTSAATRRIWAPLNQERSQAHNYSRKN